jgi:hypothetical protein
MINLIRLALAMTVVHPLEGITFGDWLRLLRRERFRIDPECWPRAVWLTAMSVANSVAARAVDRRYRAAVDATCVKAPVFILGHYRSGTTHLHELLSLDPRWATPNRFQTFHARTFLGTESWLAPIVEPFMLPRRVQEDEVAFMVRTQFSPYMDWCFPRSTAGYCRALTLKDASAAEVQAWSEAMRGFLKSLTFKTGQRIILKSPPHTARVRLILSLFPDAQFIHIRRDPYAVFVSTIGLLKAVRPVFRLQRARNRIQIDEVLENYAAMYETYFADRALIPRGQLVELAYEDLDRDPLTELRRIYDDLALGDFEVVRPRVESYIASIAGYRKNRHPKLDDETRKRVAEVCSRCFDEWGYPK